MRARTCKGYFAIWRRDARWHDDMLVRVVERPLLEVVMQQADNNQSAREWLGGKHPGWSSTRL